VNNAGLAGKAAPVWEQTDDDWNVCFRQSCTVPVISGDLRSAVVRKNFIQQFYDPM
jgi:hypothetical protein